MLANPGSWNKYRLTNNLCPPCVYKWVKWLLHIDCSYTLEETLYIGETSGKAIEKESKMSNAKAIYKEFDIPNNAKGNFKAICKHCKVSILLDWNPLKRVRGWIWIGFTNAIKDLKWIWIFLKKDWIGFGLDLKKTGLDLDWIWTHAKWFGLDLNPFMRRPDWIWIGFADMSNDLDWI